MSLLINLCLQWGWRRSYHVRDVQYVQYIRVLTCLTALNFLCVQTRWAKYISHFLFLNNICSYNCCQKRIHFQASCELIVEGDTLRARLKFKSFIILDFLGIHCLVDHKNFELTIHIITFRNNDNIMPHSVFSRLVYLHMKCWYQFSRRYSDVNAKCF